MKPRVVFVMFNPDKYDPHGGMSLKILEEKAKETMKADEYRIHFFVPYHVPPRSELGPEERTIFSTFFWEAIRRMAPKVIVFLGSSTKKEFEDFLPPDKERDRGQVQQQTQTWKKVFNKRTIWIFKGPHPFATQCKGAKRYIIEDWKTLHLKLNLKLEKIKIREGLNVFEYMMKSSKKRFGKNGTSDGRKRAKKTIN